MQLTLCYRQEYDTKPLGDALAKDITYPTFISKNQI